MRGSRDRTRHGRAPERSASGERAEEYMARRAGKAADVTVREIERSYAVVPASITEARGIVDEIEAQIEPSLVEDLKLVISELVTNVYKHSGLGPEDRVEVKLEVHSSDSVRGEVEDGSPGFEVPQLLTPDLDALGGRGLYLVDNLVERWGVQTEGGLTRAWFEMDGSAPNDSSSPA